MDPAAGRSPTPWGRRRVGQAACGAGRARARARVRACALGRMRHILRSLAQKLLLIVDVLGVGFLPYIYLYTYIHTHTQHNRMYIIEHNRARVCV